MVEAAIAANAGDLFRGPAFGRLTFDAEIAEIAEEFDYVLCDLRDLCV